ncbi:MAG: metal-dependent hydrolase [Candidatus Binatia bacterium]
MANFNTHVGVAAIGSGMLSTVCLGAGLSSPSDVATFAVVGTIGGMLPDIDSDHSSPIKLLFTGFALVAAMMAVTARAATGSILELWALAAVSYVVVRYVAWEAFGRMTVHRGIFHSVLAAFFFWFVATVVAYQLFDMTPLMAWSIGLFIFVGYNLHLILDEAFAVNLSSIELKRSFGTAFKLFDYRNWKTSAMMAVATAAAFSLTPTPDRFVSVAANGGTYQNIARRFCPELICSRLHSSLETASIDLQKLTD